MLYWVKKSIAIALTIISLVVNLFGLNTAISADFEQYKNVIFMIGDGMGENTLKYAKQELGVDGFVMETMPVRGQSKTRSFAKVTDSAAGATALACGIRTINGMIGTHSFDPLALMAPSSLSELALQAGKSVGIVTTDSTSGATPGSFSAHAANRNMERTISCGQLKSGFDLIWGASSASINEKNCSKNGFKFIENKTQLNELTAEDRSFAQFPISDLAKTENVASTPTLEEMTVKAISLLNENENGFFIMIEAAHIDKFSHSNNIEGAAHHVAEFDKAIAAALDFAKEDTQTLVIVTADHETGGIEYDEAAGSYHYTTGSHTGANVPLFVSAKNAGFVNGQAVENRKISTQTARVLGFDEKVFPTPIVQNKREESQLDNAA